MYWLSSPTVSNEVIYIGSNNHNVYALNASTGSHIWNYNTNYEVWSSPAVSNGVLFIVSSEGTVYAFGQIAQNVWNASLSTNITAFMSGNASADILIQSVSDLESDPVGWHNISLYANLTNSSAFEWAYIRMNYSTLPPKVNESSLKIFYYNETELNWAQCDVTSVNETENYVWCNTTHFTVFGVFGQEVFPPAMPPVRVVTVPGLDFAWVLVLFSLAAAIFVFNRARGSSRAQ